MNRFELFDKKVDEGWSIPPIGDWVQTFSEPNYAEYEVAVKKEDKVGTAIIGIKNPNQKNEVGSNIESANIKGWKREPVPFEVDLRAFLDEKEKVMGAVFAIRVDEVSIKDELAEVTVYTTVERNVTREKYVVVRREQLFNFKKLV